MIYLRYISIKIYPIYIQYISVKIYPIYIRKIEVSIYPMITNIFIYQNYILYIYVSFHVTFFTIYIYYLFHILILWVKKRRKKCFTIHIFPPAYFQPRAPSHLTLDWNPRNSTVDKTVFGSLELQTPTSTITLLSYSPPPNKRAPQEV